MSAGRRLLLLLFKHLLEACRTAHLADVAQEFEEKGGGEGLQVPRLGELRQKSLRRGNMQPHAASAGRQVQVQAALKPLLDELRVQWHLQTTRSQSPSCWI